MNNGWDIVGLIWHKPHSPKQGEIDNGLRTLRVQKSNALDILVQTVF
jgi:hypothetical protein